MRKSLVHMALAVAVLVAAPGVWAVVAGEADAAPDDPPPAAADLRVAYVGTAHRSIGVVSGSGADAVSDPLFATTVQHFDDEASARGATVTWVSRRTSRLAQVWVRVGAGAPVQLTSDTAQVAGHPVISPDGTRVAYAMTREGQGSARDIYVVPVSGGQPRRVTDGTGDNYWPSWSPDGTEIAFEGKRGSAVTQVWCIPTAGGEARYVTNIEGGAGEPSWNPVASRNLIAYTAAPASVTDRKVHIIARDGTNDRLMLNAAWESRQPAWSPDGVTVAFISRSTQPAGALGDVDLLYSGEPRDDGCACVAQLRYDQDRSIGTPGWYNPDGAGERLLITRTTAADRYTADLCDIRPDAVDPRDLGVTVLREDPGAAANPDRLWNPVNGDPWTSRPSYSPDGQHILISRFETEGPNRVARLWVVGADGAGARRLELAERTATGSETEAVWSPDGTRIAYSLRTPGAPARIVVVNAETGALGAALPTSTDPVGDTQPAWSPDSGTLAFARGQTEGRAANSHVRLAAADGSGTGTDITAASGGAGRSDYGVGFAPDGNRIAFGRAPDGMLATDLYGGNCQVLVPAGSACGGALIAPDDGPHHPRDVDWSPDSARLAHAGRRYAAATEADYVKTYDLASGVRDGLTWEIPGRHRWPAWQRASDLETAVVQPPQRFTAGKSTTLTLSVTDNGPVTAHGVHVDLEVPEGFRVTALEAGAGVCDVTALTCDLGTPGIGGTVRVRVTVTATGAATATLRWTAGGWLADAAPGDNTAEVRLVADAPPSPSPSISPSASPSVSPSVPVVPPAPPMPPLLQVSVVITPTPTWVGHRTTVRYTVRNVGGGTATGVTIQPRLPTGIPVVTRPANCDATVCRIGDLPPGAARQLTFVLVPQRKTTTTVRGTVTADTVVARQVSAPLRVLQPRIEAIPEIGPPGFVTIIRGQDFPPGVPVRLAWDTGVTVAANPAVPDAEGTFDAQLLVLWKDALGPRKAVATGNGFPAVTADFRVVAPAQQPPGLVLRK
ncbi:DUF11 domain-containing protein [Actinoplanes teichomyceticus]|uniref:Tol biopolymer transport system component n=1 Tax=Actinoplanes teichomyceticus TaxID=1867 RepID=A0A561WLI4_ACTTI|nr:DUF11 domain-containing protein [Actinoplanes teichomyceticus]TWG24727.1 Tol biopolymer transport system component [Actinoplanes teichomyceticus]GIF14608.1 hypothetical protein Ate01nite_46400 [Actinoplanes teichomyceticus]